MLVALILSENIGDINLNSIFSEVSTSRSFEIIDITLERSNFSDGVVRHQAVIIIPLLHHSYYEI